MIAADTLDQLYAALSPLSMDAGWRRRPGARESGTFEPGHWRYRDGRAALEVAGRLVTPELTERRNLALMNPGGGNATLTTLVAAYQLVLPGERPRSHRHSAAALRLVLDTGPDMYTIVDGVRLDMHPGDVVLTPSWCWHGHRNDGDDVALFVDYLDSPLCRRLDRYRFEAYPEPLQAVTARGGDSPYVYPWAEMQARLAATPPDPAGIDGRRIALDRVPMPTIALSLHRLDAGTRTTSAARTDNRLYTAVAGTGRTIFDAETFDWERGDVFAAPAGARHHHEANGEAVLFCVSDAPVISALGWLHPESAR